MYRFAIILQIFKEQNYVHEMYSHVKHTNQLCQKVPFSPIVSCLSEAVPGVPASSNC